MLIFESSLFEIMKKYLLIFIFHSLYNLIIVIHLIFHVKNCLWNKVYFTMALGTSNIFHAAPDRRRKGLDEWLIRYSNYLFINLLDLPLFPPASFLYLPFSPILLADKRVRGNNHHLVDFFLYVMCYGTWELEPYHSAPNNRQFFSLDTVLWG